MKIPNKTLNKLKNITHREYLYGDFDNDKVKNIDDPKPFNSKESQWPDQHDEANARFYQRAQYGGGEVLLSKELRAIELNNNQRIPMMRQFLRDNPNSFGRIKTVPSTMKKLRQRFLPKLYDIAGVTILTKDKQEAKEKFLKIKEKYHHDPKQVDNFYRNPKHGVYYAYHAGLKFPSSTKNIENKKMRLEVQVKSVPMWGIQQKMHKYYKFKRKIPAYIRKRVKRLVKQGA